MARIPFIYNLRSMRVRWISTVVAILSVAGVVTVFVAVLSMAKGFSETVKASGSKNNAMILRGGSVSEMTSAMTLEQVRIIGDASGIARDRDGTPLISPEVVVNIHLFTRSSGSEVNAGVRGVSKKVLEVRDIRITQGRFFTPGLSEIVVGKSAAEAYQHMDLGGSVSFAGQTWTVVGIFDAGGSAFDSEIWCDTTVLNQIFKRPPDIFQSVTARLASVNALSQIKDTLTTDPRLTVDVEREITYYEKQAKPLTTFIRTLGSLVAIVMAIGAVFAALNTMYAAVSARSSEIATLQALGFTGGNVVASFLLESLTLAFFGGVLGCLIVLPFNGFTASTMNWATISRLAFAFRVTPDITIQGIIFSLIMGFFGGVFPAIRAARQPIAGTLRGL